MFRADLERIRSVVRPIANAIYFKDHGQRYPGTWNVFVASMKSWEDVAGLSSRWEPFRKLLAMTQFVSKPVPYPMIFTYAVNEMPGGLVLEFVFYGAFTVYCFGPNVGGASDS